MILIFIYFVGRGPAAVRSTELIGNLQWKPPILSTVDPAAIVRLGTAFDYFHSGLQTFITVPQF